MPNTPQQVKTPIVCFHDTFEFFGSMADLARYLEPWILELGDTAYAADGERIRLTARGRQVIATRTGERDERALRTLLVEFIEAYRDAGSVLSIDEQNAGLNELMETCVNVSGLTR